MGLPFILGAATTALGLFSAKAEYDAQQDVVDYRNAQANAQYQADLQNQALAKQHRAAQRAAQRAASRAEVVRLGRELTSLEFNRVNRETKRQAEKGATRLTARDQQAEAMAAAGASGVAGVSVERLSRAYANAASRRVGAIEEESRMDVATTQLQKGDSILGSEQNLIRINQPLAPIPNVAAPSLTEGPSRSSMWLGLGTAVLGGLNTYNRSGGDFSFLKGLGGSPTVPTDGNSTT